jgi:phosphoribosylanthranilate isomerase
MLWVQMHGEQHSMDCHPRCQRIEAFRVGNQADLEAVTRFVTQAKAAGAPPRAILLDARVDGEYGGTGKTAPWRLLAGYDPGAPMILAGGLTPENVAEAIRIVRPYGVDVASGVEESPGRKNHDLIKRFVENARKR